MSLDESVSNLILNIYNAGRNSAAWDSVAWQVTDRVGAHRCFTTLVDLKDRQYDAWKFYGPDDTAYALAVAEAPDMLPIDPSLAWASRNPHARFCDSSKTLPADEYLQHPLVKWNHARLGATHWYVGYTPADEELSYSFSVHFPAAQGPGTPQSIQLFRMLFEHLACATRLNRRPFNPNSSRALLVLDRGGRVRNLSVGAERMFKDPDGLYIRGSHVVLASQSEQQRFDAALALASNVAAEGRTARAVKVTRPSAKRPWIITIRPQVESFGPFGKVCSELLIEVHDGSPQVGSLELLQSLYDLTGRELQVIRLLADGHSVESLAQELKMSSSTARTHLRAIFSKTSTGRQSELLQLCAGLAAH